MWGVKKGVCFPEISLLFPARWFANYPEFIGMAKHIFLTHRDLRGLIRLEKFSGIFFGGRSLKSMRGRGSIKGDVLCFFFSHVSSLLEVLVWRCCVFCLSCPVNHIFM